MPIDFSVIDSGVFLEVLLAQERAHLARTAIEQRQNRLIVTDFSLHAIGLVLLRNKKKELFKEFFEDVAPRLDLISLPIDSYTNLLDYHQRLNLDFDDAYQVAAAVLRGYSLVTLDSDFLKAKEEVNVVLLR